jgi:hypothetical protein
MSPAIEFKAPWSRSLRSISSFAIAFLLAATLAAAFAWWRTRVPLAMLAIVLPPLILMLCVLCIVRGYVLTSEEIVVKRLGWMNRLPIEGLISVGGDNEAMLGSWRLLGNGGLLSYSGYFWSRRTGRYRAFATDPSRAVVLCYPQRKIVITPDDPQRFIVRLRTQLKNR